MQFWWQCVSTRLWLAVPIQWYARQGVGSILRNAARDQRNLVPDEVTDHLCSSCSARAARPAGLRDFVLYSPNTGDMLSCWPIAADRAWFRVRRSVLWSLAQHRENKKETAIQCVPIPSSFP